MPISIHVRGKDVDGPKVAAGVLEAFELVREADRLFSTYQQHSEVSRIRRAELDPGLADPLVQQVITLCERAGEVTAGAFTDQLPDQDGVLRFDPTGLVMGWAADRAASVLARLPESSFCLNAGGDVVVGGTAWTTTKGLQHRGGSVWRIRVIARASPRSSSFAMEGWPPPELLPVARIFTILVATNVPSAAPAEAVLAASLGLQ